MGEHSFGSTTYLEALGYDSHGVLNMQVSPSFCCLSFLEWLSVSTEVKMELPRICQAI
jgi:hypothetical protein